MSEIFNKAFEYAMANEGFAKYTNDHRDPGGPTKWGITLKTARRNGLDIDLDGDVDENDVQLIDEAHAKRVYHNDYWSPIKGDSIASELIAIKLFDAGVNIGPVKASRIAQDALNDLGCEVVADGSIGPKTLAAINSVDEHAFMLFFVNRLIEYYRSLNKPTYTKGWTNRARRMPSV